MPLTNIRRCGVLAAVAIATVATCAVAPDIQAEHGGEQLPVEQRSRVHRALALHAYQDAALLASVVSLVIYMREMSADPGSDLSEEVATPSAAVAPRGARVRYRIAFAESPDGAKGLLAWPSTRTNLLGYVVFVNTDGRTWFARDTIGCSGAFAAPKLALPRSTSESEGGRIVWREFRHFVISGREVTDYFSGMWPVTASDSKMLGYLVDAAQRWVKSGVTSDVSGAGELPVDRGHASVLVAEEYVTTGRISLADGFSIYDPLSTSGRWTIDPITVRAAVWGSERGVSNLGAVVNDVCHARESVHVLRAPVEVADEDSMSRLARVASIRGLTRVTMERNGLGENSQRVFAIGGSPLVLPRRPVCWEERVAWEAREFALTGAVEWARREYGKSDSPLSESEEGRLARVSTDWFEVAWPRAVDETLPSGEPETDVVPLAVAGALVEAFESPSAGILCRARFSHPPRAGLLRELDQRECHERRGSTARPMSHA